MNAFEKDCLMEDDIRVFHKGACHIFATALVTKLTSEAYTLKRVVLLKCDSPQIEAYHVYAASGIFMVDASGIRRAEDYLAWLAARHVAQIDGVSCLPKVTTCDASETDLLELHHEDPYRGKVNQWNLFTGPEFVDIARKRAHMLIDHFPDKYRVSVVKSGLDLNK